MSASPPSLYVPLDANYLRDPKIRRAGPDAELLYLRGLAHSKSGETDGVIHDYDLDVIAVGLDGAEDRAAKLVEVGAWSEHPEGWFITGWFRWNESREVLEARKVRRSIGAAKTNHKTHREKGIQFSGGCPVCLGEVEADDAPNG